MSHAGGRSLRSVKRKPRHAVTHTKPPERPLRDTSV
jgi:hypothetical protein